MREDSFSKCHPIVNLLFFCGAISLAVLLQQPVYLLTGVFVSAAHYLLLNGQKGIRMIVGMIPLFLFIMFLNPILNTRGAIVLTYLFGRPYTLEALTYGMVVASVFVTVILWFGCYNKVLTGDKFTCLFGNMMPSIALLLTMVFRMIPNFIRKAKQIMGTRRAIGKGMEPGTSMRGQIEHGAIILGTLTAWALEGGVMTSDSMRARGYGVTKRSSFMIYKMSGRDWILLGTMLILIGTVVVWTDKAIGFIAYAGFLLIPIVLHIREAIQWNISKYKI